MSENGKNTVCDIINKVSTCGSVPTEADVSNTLLANQFFIFMVKSEPRVNTLRSSTSRQEVPLLHQY